MTNETDRRTQGVFLRRLCLADIEASHWPDGVCRPTCRAKDRLEQFEASQQPRYVAIRDGVLNHMAHHRGQLTVYLRLNDEKVPAIYRPSGLMNASDDDTTPGGVGLCRPFLGAAQSRWPRSACDCYEAGNQRQYSAEGACQRLS